MKSILPLLFLATVTLFAQERPPAGRDTTKAVTDTSAYKPRALRDSVVTDTLAPVYQLPEQGAFRAFSQDDLKLMNYRDGATLLQHFPATFNRSMGFPGLPSEVTFYGEGNGKISFLEDGIEINDRYSESLYFDNLHDGYIDKLSLYPSYMGFLHAYRPSQITVAVTGRDFVSGAPYSRIKYFEGPAGEGFIDVQFNQTIKNRLVLFTEITNNKVDDGFRNSNLSLWKGKVNLKYILSNRLNLAAGYNYIQQDLGLNGGVNYDSAKSLAASIPGRSLDDFLYDDRAAPVNFLNRYQKNTKHRLHFKAFGSIGSIGYVEGSLFHQTNLNEFRQNEDSLFTNPNRVLSNRRYTVTGGVFRATFDTKYFAADVHANYESVNFENEWFDPTAGFVPSGSSRRNSFSAGGILTGKLGSFALSGFGKIFIYDGTFYPGIGGEAKVEISEGLSFRAGASYLEGYDAGVWFNHSNTYTTRLEAELIFQTGNLHASVLGWGSNTGFKNQGAVMPTIDPLIPLPPAEPKKLAFGTVASLGYSLGSFTAFLDAQYNNKQLEISGKNIIPAFIAKTGISFRDTLFDDALDLKTTISYSYRTSTVATNYNFYVDRVFYTPWIDDVPASGQLDFHVAGTIQKVATLFFAWENLLGSKYYLSPYYPVLPRNIRFGITWEFLN